MMVEASNAPRVTNRLTDQIAAARLKIELAEPRVIEALAVQQQADAAIDSTDDHCAEALAELLTDFEHVLGIADHNIVVRKRPGLATPKSLPEICVSQQQNSLDDGGIFAVPRLVITAYAASAAELARFDNGVLLGLLNSAPEQMAAINAHGVRSADTLTRFKASGIGNTAQIETLEGGAVRKAYVISDFRGNLQTPRILAPLNAARAQSLGVEIAARTKTVSPITLHAFVVPETGKVIKDGPSRVLEVAVEVSTVGSVYGYTGERLASFVGSALPGIGKVVGGLGRVTHTEITKASLLTDRSGRFLVEIHAEALTS